LLQPVDSIKILGVYFTHDLKWNCHLDYVYKKSNKASYLVKLLHRRGVTGHLLYSICNALIFSHLSYCWPVFCYVSNRQLQKFSSLKSKLQKLHRVPVNISLRTRLNEQCIRLAKQISKLEDHPLEECFERNVIFSSMSFRHIKKILPLRAKRETLRNSFTKFAS
jgi:hypothetical protein